MSKAQFKIGDKVKIMDYGKIYSCYDTLAVKLNLQNFKYSSTPIEDKDIIYKIIGIGIHEYYGNTILGIEDNNKSQFLIGKEGIQLLKQIDIQGSNTIELEENNKKLEEKKPTIKELYKQIYF